LPSKPVLTYQTTNGLNDLLSKSYLERAKKKKSHKKSSSDFSPNFDRFQYLQLVITLFPRTVHSLTGWSVRNPFGTLPYEFPTLCDFARFRRGVTDTSLLQLYDTASLVTRLCTFRDYCRLTRDVIQNCRKIKSTCPC